MSGEKILKKEKRIEFIQDFTAFKFGIGYSYTDFEDWENLIHLEIMFWSIDFAWSWFNKRERNG